ncbi:hypothetical protein ACFYY8_06400 [Streptosporangium sp. NPDC001559]|uniref:hypothetical protein n=1 Tax=Streptosporangium sp. NPDC001559 TaxID=3366187 RepID=UPI0036E87A41
MRRRRTVLCVCCATPGQVMGRGLITACYQRHRSNGTLDQFPMLGAPPKEAGEAAREARLGRVQDYAELLTWGLSQREATARLGICRRTAERYNAALKALKKQEAR